MSAVGYNFCKLLRAFAYLVFYILRWCRNTLKRQIVRDETGIENSFRSLLQSPVRLA